MTSILEESDLDPQSPHNFRMINGANPKCRLTKPRDRQMAEDEIETTRFRELFQKPCHVLLNHDIELHPN
jgi:hypothetical protein